MIINQKGDLALKVFELMQYNKIPNPMVARRYFFMRCNGEISMDSSMENL